MALFAQIGHSKESWDELDEPTREDYRRVAGAMAPLMEPCWELPNGVEMDEVSRVVDNAEDLGATRSTAFAVAIAGFIQTRNRKILLRAGIRAA